MTVWVIVACISIIINVVILYYVFFNFMPQVEQLEDALIDTKQVINDTYENITKAQRIIQTVDLRGAFNSDDEVGAAFSAIRDAVLSITESLTITDA